jgi:O-antigen ligase
MIDLTKPFSFLLTAYIVSVIVFNQNYIMIPHIIDALLIALFGFYIISGPKKLKINPLITAYTLFAIFALASSLWAISFDTASFKSLQLFLIIINLVVLYNLMINFDLQNSFINGILIGSFVNYLLIMGVIPAPFEIIVELRYVGTAGNANVLAITMLMSMFVSIVYLMNENNKKNWFFYYQYLNILFAMYTIFLTVSKKGIIFGLSLLLFYVVISLKNKTGTARIVVLGTLGILIFYFFADIEQISYYFERIVGRFTAFTDTLESGSKFGSTGLRRRFIELGLEVYQDKPFLGYGLNNFRFLTEIGYYSHNNFIELLVGVGLIGFSLFYYIYYYLYTLIYKMPKSDLKTLTMFFITILLVMDMAIVSYDSKLRMFLLLFLTVYIVQNIKLQPIDISKVFQIYGKRQ